MRGGEIPGSCPILPRFCRDPALPREKAPNSASYGPLGDHSHDITNIGKDGDISSPQEANWLNARFNNFRQNVQPGGLFNAPDATIVGLLCDADGVDMMQLKISVVVKNTGALEIPMLTPVHIELDKDGVITPLVDTATNTLLLPGQFEVLDLDIPLPVDAPALPYTIRAIVDPGNVVDECVEDNNAGGGECFIPG